MRRALLVACLGLVTAAGCSETTRPVVSSPVVGRWDRLRIDLHNRPFAEIEEHLYRLLALPQLKRACIDAGGIGIHPKAASMESHRSTLIA